MVWSACSPMTPESLLQTHKLKASFLQHSVFFMVQISHPYMTTGKTIAVTTHRSLLAKWPFLFSMLSRFVTVLLPRSKHLLISWLQLPSTVILELKKIKSITASNLSPSIFHERIGPKVMILVFWMLSFNQLFYSILMYLDSRYMFYFSDLLHSV